VVVVDERRREGRLRRLSRLTVVTIPSNSVLACSIAFQLQNLQVVDIGCAIATSRCHHIDNGHVKENRVDSEEWRAHLGLFKDFQCSWGISGPERCVESSKAV
jgi:hypothetical protein